MADGSVEIKGGSRRHEQIVLAHGGGGQLTAELIREMILPRLGNEVLASLGDAGCVGLANLKVAFTTDSYVVQPLEFPGGDIGRLAICGTVNDLAVAGAEPVAVSLSLILEEGLESAVLERVLDSISQAAREAGVFVATGDTKVVERGRCDGMYITTSGIGTMLPQARLGLDRLEPGDAVLINGPIAQHGLAVLSRRKGLEFAGAIESDVAAIARLANSLLRHLADAVKFMRDPTRGGLAGVLAEMAAGSGLSVEVHEEQIPIEPAVAAAAEVLGIDPLTVANEGKFVAVVAAERAEEALQLLRQDPLGAGAAIIGRITDAQPPIAELVTRIGGRRVIQVPYGEELPRIC